MKRIVSLPVLAALVLLEASCSQQVQQPVKKQLPPPYMWARWSRCILIIIMC